MNICLYCKKDTPKPKFCSPFCAGKFGSDRRWFGHINIAEYPYKKLNNCKYCKMLFEGLNRNQIANHSRWCKFNPKRQEYIDTQTILIAEACKFRKIENRSNLYIKAKKEGRPVPISPIKGRKGLTTGRCKSLEREQSRNKKISEKRKSYLRENRNKHNWSLYRREETSPESAFKNIINNYNVEVFQYYIPKESEKNYEIDFAIPSLKLGFEIDGNQHYDDIGNLNEYNIKRNEYFKSLGWKIVNIHYLICFHIDKIKEIIDNAIKRNDINLNKITYEIFNHRKIRKFEKEQKKEQREKEINLKNILHKNKIIELNRYRIELLLISKIDLMKFGWVSKVASLWHVSPTQVRRLMNRYHPNVAYFERKATLSVSPQSSKLLKE